MVIHYFIFMINQLIYHASPPRILYNCGKVYIGKTVRRLETGIKEDKDACKKGAVEKSIIITEHACMD